MTDREIAGEALTAPAAARNRDPILAVLRRVLPRTGLILEVASGTGEHAVHFAARLPDLAWQPTDPDPDMLRSIAAHRARAALPNLRPPLILDAAAPSWPVARADGIVAINLIHIAPWAAAEGLMRGAAGALAPGAPLTLYGPFSEDGRHTAPSNAAFDADLRRRDPAWGVRAIGAVTALARGHGLTLAERIAMPANNLSLVFRRTGRADAPPTLPGRREER